MKVHLIKRQTIEDYVRAHARSKSSFAIWLTAISRADWKEPADILATFGAADLLGNSTQRVVFDNSTQRVVFDIGGNSFRMIAKYVFSEHQVHLFVCWIGTHAAYSQLCSRNEQYIVELY